MSNTSPLFAEYNSRLSQALATCDWSIVEYIAQELLTCWQEGRHLFICGNGGSAGNALHLTNDYLYGIGKASGAGMKVTALSANSSVITCLANDLTYDKVFSQQIKVLANSRDVLLVLSGSGNSPNVVEALLTAKSMGLKTFAILGYTGGRCKDIADTSLHFELDDMQIAEDLQLIIGHMWMQYLAKNDKAS